MLLVIVKGVPTQRKCVGSQVVSNTNKDVSDVNVLFSRTDLF